MIVSCTQCSVEFSKPASHVKRVRSVFCSVACHDTYQRKEGRRQGTSLEKTCKICGGVFVVQRSAAHKYSTCSRSCYKQAKQRENNGNWKGGLTGRRKADLTTARYKKWRTRVFERDDYTCIACGTRGGQLCADHIQTWAHNPELRYSVDNGRTLCEDCHKLTYYYGLRRVLTDDQAVQIVEQSRRGETATALAQQYGVSVNTVSKVTRYERYQHATCALFGQSFPRTCEERLALVRESV